jgi:branched-chain amino acid transport system substrate-binding protein
MLPRTLKVKSVAIVDDSTAYGQGLANEFEKTAKSLGMNVMSHDATNDKAVDFRAILTKIKGENPDAIMYGGMDATGGPFAKQAKQLGLRARFWRATVCVPTKLSTWLATQPTTSSARKPVWRSRRWLAAAFEAKFQKRFGQPIQIYAPFTYDAVYIIVDAMKRANSTDPAKILAAMPNTDYKGVIGETTFDSKGDLQHGVISLYDYKGGKKTLLDVVKM